MRRTLIRVASLGAAGTLIAACAAGGALASTRHGAFGAGVRAGGFGPGGGMNLPFRIGRGFPGGQVGGGAFRFGIGGSGAGGILGLDVLDPAASFLGIPVGTLESDLANGSTLAEEAKAKGKSASDLIDAVVASEKSILDGEKTAGWITGDQETSLETIITNEITALVNNGPPVAPSSTAHAGGLLQTASTYLGISVSDLQNDLKGGKSLAGVIATVSGKTVGGLVSALEAPVKSRLDAQVSSKKITQSQEDAILANLTTRLTNLINHTKPASTQAAVLKTLARYATVGFVKHR
jgi:hypothetical protein